ncbi:hypothetical protein BO71DRAFT_465563 [Aspergillus ellipticus CBS 707.79]|uniref:Transferase family protein n=1 Tax=Aspergillus ellipticus CBS 707.79 TaxID=1448320 RepID=A0A319CX28_9EURO|nr:hypothetical protein BO71DRAFT_465563 [Aspergillus ellipticus CBS 707.79]
METPYRCQCVHPFTCRALVLTGLLVDACLDEEILRQTAAQLIDAWPVLGGQLHRTDILPWALSTGSTVDFQSRQIDLDVEYWTQKGILPPDTITRPTVVHSLHVPQLDEMLIFDVPAEPENVFLMRATVLRDATLLCFGISHHLADGRASSDVIRAFCDLLSDRPIPTLVLPPDARGGRMSDRVVMPRDPLHPIPAIGYAEHLGNFTSGFWPIFLLLAAFMWDAVLCAIGLQEPLEEKFIYLPDSWVNAVRDQALDTLSALPDSPASDSPSDSPPTKNNILCAWYLKTLYDPLPPATTPIDLYGPLDYRPMLQPPPAGQYWLHNSIGLLRQPLTTRQIQHASMAALAARLRHTTLRYTTPHSIQAYLRLCEDHASQRLLPRVRGRGPMPMVLVTPWTGFDLAGLDFSGACRGGGRARVMFVNPLIRHRRQGRWPSAVVSKSLRGGYWMRAWNTRSGWRGVERGAGSGLG